MVWLCQFSDSCHISRTRAIAGVVRRQGNRRSYVRNNSRKIATRVVGCSESFSQMRPGILRASTALACASAAAFTYLHATATMEETSNYVTDIYSDDPDRQLSALQGACDGLWTMDDDVLLRVVRAASVGE